MDQKFSPWLVHGSLTTPKVGKTVIRSHIEDLGFRWDATTTPGAGASSHGLNDSIFSAKFERTHPFFFEWALVCDDIDRYLPFDYVKSVDLIAWHVFPSQLPVLFGIVLFSCLSGGKHRWFERLTLVNG